MRVLEGALTISGNIDAEAIKKVETYREEALRSAS